MGNKYAPYYAARLYLKGADKLPADRNRALSLFKLSANRGLELANLDLAFGYDKGSFTGKADVPLAYYYGVLAEKLGVTEPIKRAPRSARNLTQQHGKRWKPRSISFWNRTANDGSELT